MEYIMKNKIDINVIVCNQLIFKEYFTRIFINIYAHESHYS